MFSFYLSEFPSDRQLRVGTRAQQKDTFVEYYDQPILARIGHKLGRTIRNDDSAASSTGAKFARISEEIDLNKPLCSKFRMKRKIWKAEDENLHLVCFHCRKHGHRKESCSDMQEGNNLDSMDENSPPSVPVADPTPVIRPKLNGNPTPQGKSVCFESVNEGASTSNVRPQGYLVVNGPRNALPRPKQRGVMVTHESHKLKDHQTAAMKVSSSHLIYCEFYIGTAASSSFHSILMELLRMNRVDIVIIAEPIISAINNGGKQQDQGSNNTMVDGVAAEISFSDAGTEETV
ncbi:hypothetical protein POTOM_034323 [Populus tomentosa]|uniref:CCHC-type domain-containing protein n=1 Tax=Populus tomentosa TaxID=118781 RepID=A0A8X7Z4N1_POPTO|nr:hypothetical protein POTOM_034323 [Populus tomentosa]